MSRDSILLERFERRARGQGWSFFARSAARVSQVARAFSARRRLAAPRVAVRSDSSFAAQTSALRNALRSGAYRLADLQGEQVLDRVSGVDDRSRAMALPALIEWLVAVGRGNEATELARRYRHHLEATAAGWTCLENVGAAETLRLVLPGGRPNFLGICRALRSGDLEPEAIVGAFARRPWVWFLFPELGLCIYNGLLRTDPERALAFLNRFLSSRSGEPIQLKPPSLSGRFLDRFALASASSAPAERGPCVSVLLCARNAGETVEAALRSITEDRYRDVEILAADDASDDRTLEVLRSAAADDSRIRVFASAERQGPYNLRNALLAHASGDWVTCQDADDLALPGRLAAQVAAVVRRGASACVADWLRIRTNGEVVFFRDQRAQRLSIVSLLFRRSLVAERRAPFRPVRFGADLEFYEDLRARLAPRTLRRLATPLLLGAWSDTSLTQSSGAESLANGFRSPARRVYSQLISQKHGPDAVDDETFERELSESGNAIRPQRVTEVT